MADENIIFENDEVTVTNARFIVRGQTFAIRGITSLDCVRGSANYTTPGLLILCGIASMLAGLAGFVRLATFGAAMLAFGIWLCFRKKPTYTLVLRTAGGEIKAISSKDGAYVYKVLDALNEAIVAQ